MIRIQLNGDSAPSSKGDGSPAPVRTQAQLAPPERAANFGGEPFPAASSTAPSLDSATFVHRNLYPIEVERGYIVVDIILLNSTKNVNSIQQKTSICFWKMYMMQRLRNMSEMISIICGDEPREWEIEKDFEDSWRINSRSAE